MDNGHKEELVAEVVVIGKKRQLEASIVDNLVSSIVPGRH
jgi:hypothetical protein